MKHSPHSLPFVEPLFEQAGDPLTFAPKPTDVEVRAAAEQWVIEHRGTSARGRWHVGTRMRDGRLRSYISFLVEADAIAWVARQREE